MDPVTNPYVPGAGRKPAALEGRESTLTAWKVSLERAEAGTTDQPLILYGLRGVGKTVLLTQLRHDAQERGWWVVQVEAGSGRSLRELLGEGLYEPLTEAIRPSAGERLLRALRSALSFKASYDSSGTWSFGLDLSDVGGVPANSGVLETDVRIIVRDVALAAREENVGLAILIDEAQDLERSELVSLAAVAQGAALENWPVLIAFAGLPNLPTILAEAKSYTERFQFTHIERLSEDDAASALTKPAHQVGVSWSPEALRHVVESSGRYPYFIQQFGQDVWNQANSDPIDEVSARVGVALGQNQLDSGFFRARWDRATQSEKRYLRAMVPGGDAGIGSSDVATRLGKSPSSFGPARASLIHKGLIYAPDHGIIGFTVPGMEAFISRQPGE